jgi:hypothetical protein
VLRAGPTGLTHTMCKKSQELTPSEFGSAQFREL